MSEKEPWRIDRDSVHWKLLTGWLSEFFKPWLIKMCRKYTLTEEELLVAIVETVRKISYQTILIEQKRTSKEIPIPAFIITHNPTGENTVIKILILDNHPPGVFCNREAALEKLGPFARLSIELLAINEVLVRVTGGPLTLGSANEFLVAYNFLLIIRAIEDLLQNKLSDNYYLLVETIIEETIHYCDWQTNEVMMKQIIEEFQKLPKDLTFAEQTRLKQSIEEEYGIKKRVKEIFKIFKEQKDLFSPLLEKIQKSAS